MDYSLVKNREINKNCLRCHDFFSLVKLENSATKFKMDANLTTPVLICKQFNAFNVTYVIHKERTNTKEYTLNAFDRMMSSASKKFAPDKIQVSESIVGTTGTHLSNV